MNYFPLCMDLDGAKVFLVGQGKEAQVKLEKLLPYGCEIWRFSRSGFETMEEQPQIRRLPRELKEEDLLSGPAFVVVAEEEQEEKQRISRLCREKQIPVNVVDEPPLCSFYFPALITRGAFTLAISTSGKSPAAASLLRQRFEKQIPDRMEELLDWSQALRQQLREEFPDGNFRRTALRRLVALAMEKERPLTQEETKKMVDELAKEMEMQP